MKFFIPSLGTVKYENKDTKSKTSKWRGSISDERDEKSAKVRKSVDTRKNRGGSKTAVRGDIQKVEEVNL